LLFLKYLRPHTPLHTSIPILHFQESRLGFKCNRGGLASYPENIPSEFSHSPVYMPSWLTGLNHTNLEPTRHDIDKYCHMVVETQFMFDKPTAGG
jgi:hypothetical protein